MESCDAKNADVSRAYRKVLGSLNYSSGGEDPQFYSAMNVLFAAEQDKDGATWQLVLDRLKVELTALAAEGASAFEDVQQVTAILEIAEVQFLPAYWEFHSDLLFHQSPDILCSSFFLARIFESILKQGSPWDEPRRIVNGTIALMNDYVGYRPLAVLENRKLEPYPHERVAPIPLFIKGVGIASGKYERLVSKALELLGETDAELSQSAGFSLECLRELAFDPRAFDFDHPVNRRPNYQFGEWDPDLIDLQGCYFRFVVREVTLNALCKRIESNQNLPYEELLFEAAAVLAGTILMGSGICGWGPEAHDSTESLGGIVQRIALYRDAFYEGLIERVGGVRADRLRKESEEIQQPFGASRQHLNTRLGRLRAAQREHAHLARLYARMGFFTEAREEAIHVPAPSARILCQLDCWLTAAHAAVDQCEVGDAASYLPLIRDLMERGIQCGAIIDPWNILGLDARFPLFLRPEDSVHDERADELISLVHRFLGLHSRIWSEAAARHETELCQAVDDQFQGTVNWWRQFAAHEVDAVEALDVQEAYLAAKHVAQALDLWHQGGAATGDVAFWAPHAAMFDSPQAYALVVEALLDRNDFVASMGLLMHWLCQADRVGLRRDEDAFFPWMEQWLLQLREASQNNGTDLWPQVRRFLDYLEANAEDHWRPPRFDMEIWSGESLQKNDDSKLQDQETDDWDDEEEKELFEAAYENVVFRGSTDDGTDSSLFDAGGSDIGDHSMLLAEAERVEERLAFIHSMARIWKLIAATPEFLDGPQDETGEVVLHWIEEAAAGLTPLQELIDDIHLFDVGSQQLDRDSLIEYDRRRTLKDSLVDAVILVAVELSEAVQFLCSAAIAYTAIPPADVFARISLEADEQETVKLFAALLKQDLRQVRRRWDRFVSGMESRPLLYVPISRGGNPHEIVHARMRQRAIQNLLAWLPRQGLLAEACQLIEIARVMEQSHPVGPGAVTEFDELFRHGFRAIVQSVVRSAESWTQDHQITDDQFVVLLEQFTELLLRSWLSHSQTLRLSVLERLPKDYWEKLVAFIRRYGSELFTQEFLNMGNLRAILHQGVRSWLTRMQESDDGESLKLCREIEQEISSDDAVQMLNTVFEAVIENYAEYRDYNSMTTQSDRGDCLYTLFDFIRLRTQYDRMLWKLTPVILAHETLVRRRHEEVAEVWRTATKQRTSRQARSLLRKLALLQQTHAMRMPSIMDRLGEQFVKSMSIDRMRAMVRPAIEERTAGEETTSFGNLKDEVSQFMEKRSGAGWDLPVWLLALDEEVLEVTREHINPRFDTTFRDAVPAKPLSRIQIRRQLTRATRLTQEE